MSSDAFKLQGTIDVDEINIKDSVAIKKVVKPYEYLLETDPLSKNVANRLQVFEADIMEIKTIKGNDTAAIGFEFSALGNRYSYYYDSKEIISMK